MGSSGKSASVPTASRRACFVITVLMSLCSIMRFATSNDNALPTLFTVGRSPAVAALFDLYLTKLGLSIYDSLATMSANSASISFICSSAPFLSSTIVFFLFNIFG